MVGPVESWALALLAAQWLGCIIWNLLVVVLKVKGLLAAVGTRGSPLIYQLVFLDLGLRGDEIPGKWLKGGD
jgi:hypothetical protein